MDTDIFSHDKWQFAGARSGSKSCRLALFEAGDEILRQNRGFGGLCRQTVAGATHEQIVIGGQLGVHVGQLLAEGFHDAGRLAEELWEEG